MNIKKVKLFEDFAAGEVSNPDQTVTPASKTQTDSVSVDKKAEGAEIRAEIIKDVDAILNNLETLSTRIQENINTLKEDVKSGTELSEEVEAALEELNSLNEGEINEEGPSKVMDLIWYAPKARKAMKKVNKVKNNQVAIELAKDTLPNDKENKDKKDKLKAKADAVKKKADDLEKAVRDKFSDRGDIVSKTIQREDIKGKLERIKKQTGMSNDPNKKADLKTQAAEMQKKLDQETEAMKELTDGVDKEEVKQKKEELADTTKAPKKEETTKAPKKEETTKAPEGDKVTTKAPEGGEETTKAPATTAASGEGETTAAPETTAASGEGETTAASGEGETTAAPETTAETASGEGETTAAPETTAASGEGETTAAPETTAASGEGETTEAVETTAAPTTLDAQSVDTELPKKIELYEGMRISDKFRALMNK